MKQVLTQKRLKEVIDYDPETGLFTRLVDRRGPAKAGDIAGGINKASGYVQIRIDGKKYQAHRLAHLFMEGYFPEYEMDHKKGIRHDNRWSEIEHATHLCNMQNQTIYINNTSGFQGVCWYKQTKKWRAKITIKNKIIHLGYHQTAIDAALARLTVEIQCPEWTCNHRGELVKAIKLAWPEFNEKCLGETL